MQGEKLLNSKAVQERTGLSRATLWRLENAGTFPKKKRITPGRVGWLESEIDEWIRSRAVGDI